MKKYLIGFLIGVFGLYAAPILANQISFPDVPVSSWFYNDVMNMVSWGVIQGNNDGTFAPDRFVNRAELSAMWNRYENHISDKYYSQKEVDRKFAILEKKLAVDSSTSKEEKIEYDTTDVINAWDDYVAWIGCDFRYSDTGETYMSSAGSGSIYGDGSTYATIITNKHVVTDKEGYVATVCYIHLPGMEDDEYYTSSIGHIYLDNKYDIAYLDLDKIDTYINDLTKNDKFPVCDSVTTVETGDEVVILGYPAYSSLMNLTATEGIISGYESPYFLTSAKIEQGNSGGLAVLVKENCYLGIPTGVVTGAYESLGRILDFSILKTHSAHIMDSNI